MRSDIKFYFRGRCSREILPLRQNNSATSFLQRHESGTSAGWSARRRSSESERISQEIEDGTSFSRITKRQISNTITASCDNDTQGVFPVNTTPEGLARTIKAQYYKTGAANILRTDGFGATGVVCLGDSDI